MYHGAETGRFCENWMNSVSVDALAPHIAIQDGQVLVFHEEEFQLLVPVKYACDQELVGLISSWCDSKHLRARVLLQALK